VDQQEDRHWHKLAVPLSWLCSLDDHPSPNALADAFGDRYLYRHNPIFARVRDAALGFGYRFSSENTPLWQDYHALSLTTLHRIVSDRTIPYVDTVTTMQRLLELNPKAAMSPGFLLSNLKANHAFHESAHCVAHSVLRSIESDIRTLAPDQKGRLVLEAVLAESFANTVERLGAIVEKQPISDGLFYSLNSYIPPHPKRTEVLNAVGTQIGPSARFTAFFLSSFEANLTVGPPSESAHERVAVASGRPEAEVAAIRRVTDASFDLSGGFRENTTPMYFDLLGHGKEYMALAGSQWLADAAHQRFARDLVNRLFVLTNATTEDKMMTTKEH
jgi:hypothetical protein